MRDFETQVNRGIAHLDKICPDWYKKIDLSVFNMAVCNRCVLGQVFGDYYADMVHGLNSDDRVSHGFNTMCATKGSFDRLAELWVEEIQRRRLVAASRQP